MQDLPEDLAALLHNLALWRKKKTSPQQKMPQALSDQVFQLIGKYGAAKVCKLGQLSNPRRWEERAGESLSGSGSKMMMPLTGKSALTRLATEVLSARAPIATPQSSDSQFKVEVRTPTGTLLIFHNYPPIDIVNCLKEAGLC